MSYFKRQLDEQFLVFTLDAEYDDPFIEALVDYNNIENYPALVIEGETYESFKNKEELKEIFCQKEPSLAIC